VATSSTRQRKLARAKLDRQLARRAEKERRQRQVRAAAAGVLTLALLVLGGMWIGGVFDKETPPLEAAPDCSWTKQDTAANTNLKDVGTPAEKGITKTGTSTMAIALKSGETSGNVTVELNNELAKCGSAALAYLAARNFYGETKCHELTHAEGSYALRCGDPSETGNGGAAFTWYPENVPPAATDPSASPSPEPSGSPAATASPTPSASPAPAAPRYPAGTVAMANGLYGSQFLIFYKDSTLDANYSVVGRVTSGLDLVTKIADAGTVPNSAGTDTKPKNDVIIQSLTVTSDVPSPTPSVDPSASPQPSPTATPAS
jgi:peptidyl-prolyl cis-trans isomerase B (cyclophilin B)